MSDKRCEVRYLCGDPAQVRLLPEDGAYFSATVLDISRSGLRLSAQHCFSKGQEIETKPPRNLDVLDDVRYSCRVSEIHHVGIRSVEVFGDIYNNDHLHEDQLWLFSAGTEKTRRNGLTAAELLSVGDHLRKCEACCDRYEEVTRVKNQLVARGAQP